MTIFATDTLPLGNLVKHEYEPTLNYTRESVTANEATLKSYVIGTALGKITASGKYKIAVETAVDGSKDPVAVVLENKSIPATTDTKVLVMLRGPAILSKSAVLLDATYDNGVKQAAFYASLEAKQMLVSTAV
jgi:hypothetical protein